MEEGDKDDKVATTDPRCQEWIAGFGATLLCAVAPADFASGGRGLCALEDIPCGTEIMTLPMDAMLRVPDSSDEMGTAAWDFKSLDALLAELKSADADAARLVSRGWQMRLALLLLIEKHKVGNKSPAWPFICSLPASTTSDATGWEADGSFGEEPAAAGTRPALQLPRLDSWLQGKLAFARRIHDGCIKCTATAPCFGGVQLQFDELLWAIHHVTTRAFEVHRGGGGAIAAHNVGNSVMLRGLVPLIDHLNHGGNAFNAVVTFETERQLFALTTTCAPFSTSSASRRLRRM